VVCCLHIFLKVCLQIFCECCLLLCFKNNAGVSHNAYADDVLLVSHTRSELPKNLHVLTNVLGKIGLFVIAYKCEFLRYNISNPARHFHVVTMLLESLSKIHWLGVTFSITLSATYLSQVVSALQCICILNLAK
jgi:hypothetical protein